MKPSDICWGTYAAMGPSWLRPPPCLEDEDARVISDISYTVLCWGSFAVKNQRCVLREQAELRGTT